MAQPFLDNLKTLADRHLPARSDIECKHFFGGAALYIGGVICVSLSPVGLALKLPEARCAEVIESGAAVPLRYFEKSPIKKGYVLIAQFDELDDDTIAMYFGEAVRHASSADA